jgi:glycerophosphoryl diester phosphodiesterase
MTLALLLQVVEIVAHRGASKDAPENTLQAFRLGWEQGDANELDVHLSKDGRLVVIHDASTKRTAKVDKPVVEQTFEELKALGVPALEEVVEGVPQGKRLLIEVKCGEEALPPLGRALEGRPPERFAIIGFSYAAMAKAKKLLPAIPVYWLAGYKAETKIDDLIAKARAGGLDGLDLSHEFPIDAAFAKKVHDAGLKLYTWTVNDAELARRQAAAGVDGITTDRPAWLRARLKD